jgi:hypothetical protein
MPSLHGGGFADFVSLTAPKVWSSPDKFTNNLQRTGGTLLPRLLMGREGGASIGGGERIREYLLTKPNQTFRFHGVNEPTPGWQQGNHTDKVEIPYRFAEAHTSYTDQEVDLNEGDPAVTWKRVKEAKLAALWTAVVYGIEDTFFATPDVTNMESFTASPGKPYSIPAFVNEQTGGRFGTVTSGTGTQAGVLATPWTTGSAIETLALTTDNNWKCAQQGYGNSGADGFVNTDIDNIYNAFNRMWLDVQFKSPGLQAQYFEDAKYYRQVIGCSADGLVKYNHVLRSSNQNLPSMQDPAYTGPRFGGIMLERIPSLDSALLYSKSGAATTVGTEATAAITGPRYYWLNFNHLKCVWHPKHYMKMGKQFTPEFQQETTVLPVMTWFNMICTSLRHQGIVYPLTNS